MIRKSVLVLWVFGCLVLGSGCIINSGPGPGTEPDEQFGSLNINWTFDSEASCPSDVENVVVQIEGMDDRIVSCTLGALEVGNLAPASYEVQLKGIETDENGDEVISWESIPQDMNVLAGRVGEFTVDLEPAP